MKNKMDDFKLLFLFGMLLVLYSTVFLIRVSFMTERADFCVVFAWNISWGVNAKLLCMLLDSTALNKCYHTCW